MIRDGEITDEKLAELHIGIGVRRKILSLTRAQKKYKVVCNADVKELILDLKDFRSKPELFSFENYRPEKDCLRSITEDASHVFTRVTSLPSILNECSKSTSRKLATIPEDQQLPYDEAFALILFSFELGWNSCDESGCGRDNFHAILRSELRNRDPKTIMQLKSYMYYLMNGLDKQPIVTGVVFRGVPAAALHYVQKKYREKRVIQWPNYTLTSTSLPRAKGIAKWPDGIIFEINMRTGRSLLNYSLTHSEDEVLISPNSRFIVVCSVEKRSDGFHYLMISEQP